MVASHLTHCLIFPQTDYVLFVAELARGYRWTWNLEPSSCPGKDFNSQPLDQQSATLTTTPPNTAKVKVMANLVPSSQSFHCFSYWSGINLSRPLSTAFEKSRNRANTTKHLNSSQMHTKKEKRNFVAQSAQSSSSLHVPGQCWNVTIQ